jgi:mono/diheme cytochrome c family protein
MRVPVSLPVSLPISLFAMSLAVPVSAQDAAVGADLFQHYCAACHGSAGDGSGPMASVLLVQPSDLTGLSARNDGVFPIERVVMRIDGRDPLVSHGSPMPVWGPFFDGQDALTKSETGQPLLTSVPILDLLAWLTEIQH